MSKIDQAREWAERMGKIEGLMPGHRAAIEVIQSLPDQWVDVEKVREITDRHNDLIVDFLDQIEGNMNTDTWEAIRDFMCELNVEVDTLAIPKLPTLADMTAEEREACQWMQCKIDGHNEPQVLSKVGQEYSWILLRNGNHLLNRNEFITPLTGEPKLELPGSHADTITAESVKDVQAGRVADFEPALPRPEDVPANEPWLIEVDGQKAIGARYAGDSAWPWTVAALNGLYANDYSDNTVTLIHKLVPEPPALPEGMRLADHETYGRVVVSPKTDSDGDYRIFCSQDQTEYGDNWWYAHKSDLTFLDGEK